MLRTLRARERSLELGARPWLMGVVNASPDSFSDAGTLDGVEAPVEVDGSVRGNRERGLGLEHRLRDRF